MAKCNIQITRSCNYLIKWQNSIITKYCSAAEPLKKYCSIPKIVLVCNESPHGAFKGVFLDCICLIDRCLSLLNSAKLLLLTCLWLTLPPPRQHLPKFGFSGPSNREKWWWVINPNPGPNMSLQHMDDGTDAKSMFFYILRFTDTQMHNSTIWNVSKWADLFLEHKKCSNERNPEETEKQQEKCIQA